MKLLKMLCLTLALALMAGGCLAEAADAPVAANVDQPVEELELSLGGDALADAAEAAVLAAEAESVGDAEGEQSGEAEAEAGEAGGEAEPSGEEPGETEGAEEHEAILPQAVRVPRRIEIGVGEEYQLTPVVEPEGATYDAITYESSRVKYAKVTKKGLIRARKVGTAIVTVTAGNVMAQVRVKVRTAPTEFTLKAAKQYLNVGETTKVKVKMPKNTAGSTTLSVKPKGIIEITPEGVVTALKQGTATVTATAYNGAKASVEITVRAKFEITFMDIGRNDGILIQCDGEFAFIDSGLRGYGLQAVQYMQAHNVEHLKYYIGTHAHRDHVGGAPAIIAAIPTDEVIVSHSGTARKIRDFAETDAERSAAQAATYRVVKAGDKLKLGSARFKVLGPLRVLNVNTGDGAENGNSLVMRLTYGSTSFLLTGDATGSELTDIEKAKPGCMKATVLKNPHHNGTQKYAVTVSQPKIVIFSTSSSCLPSYDYLKFITGNGAKYYVTAPNRNSHVTITSTGKKLKVKTVK